MLLFIDSCGDHYDTSQVLSKWDFTTTPNGYSIVSARSGNGIKIHSASVGPNLLRNLTSDYSGLVVGIAFYLTILPHSNTTLVSFADTGVCQASLCVNISGQLYVTRGTSAASPGFASPGQATLIGTPSVPGLVTGGQWHYAEMQTLFSTGTSGEVTVRLGNRTVIAATNVITAATSNSTANQLVLWGAQDSNGGNDNTFDDIYLASTSDGGVTTFLGDRRVGCLFPVSDYSVSLDTSAGSDHYSLVNATTPDGDSTYVASATPGDTDLYTLQSLPESIVVVNGMQSVMYARKDDASARSVAPRFSDGTATSNGASISLPQSYGYRLQAFDASPVDGSPLTPTKVNNLKAGIDIVS